MKKIKFFIIIISALIISGCSNEYIITIKDGSIQEEIITINKKIKDPDKCSDTYIECDNDSYEILNYNYFPVVNNFEKEFDVINESTNDEIISKRTYTFTYDEYEKSNALNSCFENIKFENSTFKININVSDMSKCYENDIVIKVKTDYTVLSNNADKKEGNTLIWDINNSNYKTKTIKFEVLKFSIVKIILYISIAIIVLSVIYFFRNKFKKVNEIN